MSTAKDESSNFLNDTGSSNDDEETELKFDPLSLVKTEEDPGCGDVDESFDNFQFGNDSLQLKTEIEGIEERSIGSSRKKTSGGKKRNRKLSYAQKIMRNKLRIREKRAAEAAVKCRQELEAVEALLDEPGKVDPALLKLWEFVENPDGSRRRKRVEEMTTEEQIHLKNRGKPTGRMYPGNKKERDKLRRREKTRAAAAAKCTQELQILEALLDTEPDQVDPTVIKVWEVVPDPDGSKRRKRVDEMTPEEQLNLLNLVRQLKEASLEEKGKRTQQKARVEKELKVLEAFLDSEDPGESCQVDPEVLKAWEVIEAPDGSKRRKRVDEMTPKQQICLWKLVRKQKRSGKGKAKRNRSKKVETEEEMRQRRMKAYMQHVAKTASMTPEEKEQFRLKTRERDRKNREKLVAKVGLEGVRAMKRNRYHSMTPERKKAFLEKQGKYYKRKMEELKKDPERLRFLKTARNIRRQKKALEEREKKGITVGRRNVTSRYYWRRDFPDLPPEEIERMALARKKEVMQRTQLRWRLKQQGLHPEEIQRQINELIQMQNSLPPGAPGKPSLDFGERKRKTEPGSGPSTTPKKRNRIPQEKPAAIENPAASEAASVPEVAPNPALIGQCHSSQQRYPYYENYLNHQPPLLPPNTLQPVCPQQQTDVQPSRSGATSEQFDHSTSSSYNEYGSSQYDNETGGYSEPASPDSLNWEPTPPAGPVEPPPQAWGVPPKPQEPFNALPEPRTSAPAAPEQPKRGRGRPPRTFFANGSTPAPGQDVVCDDCGTRLSQRSLANHIRYFHNPNYDLHTRTCKICGGHFPRAEFWYNHYRKDHPQHQRSGSHLCDQYGKYFSTSGNLTAHKNTQQDDASAERQILNGKHLPKSGTITPAGPEQPRRRGRRPRIYVANRPQEQDVVCDECGLHLTQKALAMHKRHFHSPNYDLETRTCKICGVHFLRADFWYKHYLKDHHQPQRRGNYVCDQCGKGFSSSGNLTIHKKGQHDDSGNRLFKCAYCPQEKILKGKHSYQSHCQRLHPEVTLEFRNCPRCSKLFPSLNALNGHMKEAHPESFFPCKWCPMVRHSDMGLRFHHRKCQKMPKDVRTELMKKSNEYFPEFYLVPCELCGHKVTLTNMSVHYKGIHHVKEEDFKCFYCEKNFKQRPFWMIHMEEFHGHKLETFYDKLGLLNASNREGLKSGARPTALKMKSKRKIKVIAEED